MNDMYVAKNEEIAYRIIDSETVILTPGDGILHNLNQVGTRIFELVNGKRSIRVIFGIIADKFKVKEDVAKRDTFSFIKDLISKNILLSSDKPFA